ncbi:uncharacterized protein LOC124698912 isoform X1 [Lolium rigidum]|uniref:uncharacterized protein LOC124698912 isoform X1 n=1 Tax=Lolium rigidum TaxID=89674 RepID=UPI001F5CFF51|nr:uncharacterized protein LOC124698912 isoform X1 [Lolium rigidum]
MLQMTRMERSPALHLAVVALLGFCCLVHASSAAIQFPPAAPRVQRETEAIPASSGADGQAVITREANSGGFSRRMEMDMELEDYPGSGANDRHSPWRQERRN